MSVVQQRAGSPARTGVRRRAGWSAALLAGIAALVYGVLVQTVAGQRWDSISLGVGGRFDDVILFPVAGALRTSVQVLLGAFGLTLLVLFARASSRRRALSAGTLIATALIGSELIKRALPRPYLGNFGYPYSTFPSGHTAAATGLVLAGLLVLPDRYRGIRAVVVAAFAVPLLAYSSVITQAHLISDVLGAILITGAVAALLTAVSVRPVVPPAGRRLLLPALAAGVAAGAVAWSSGGSADPLVLLGLAQFLGVISVVALVVALLATIGPVPDGRTAGRPATTPR